LTGGAAWAVSFRQGVRYGLSAVSFQAKFGKRRAKRPELPLRNGRTSDSTIQAIGIGCCAVFGPACSG